MIEAKLPDCCLDVTRRHDFAYLFDVTYGNPNGDPDGGNVPRFDPETMHGIVTDVCLKRKVRDFLARRGVPIFIQSEVALNTLITQAFRDEGARPPEVPVTDEALLGWLQDNAPEGFSLEGETLTYGGESVKEPAIRSALLQALEDPEGNRVMRDQLLGLARQLAKAAKGQGVNREMQEKARQRLCRQYFDIRMFGAVLSTGLNAGQVRGPAQITFAQSIDPVFPLDWSITRQARTTSERMATGGTEMGRKTFVPYGLYRAHGFFSPSLGKQTQVTSEDLRRLWEALAGMFEEDRSASRGMMACRGLYVFTHENPLGNAHAHELFDRVAVELVSTGVPRCFGDYRVAVDEGALPEGVVLSRLVDYSGA